MPPSGYSPRQADDLVSFLRSCSEALVDECLTHGRSLGDGLRSEIRGIDSVLPSFHGTPVPAAALLLTRDFYARLALSEARYPGAWDEEVERELKAVKAQILAIHVPS